MPLTTTLNKIREQGPCEPGWAKLLKSLGKTKADDEPLNIEYILDSNGLDDAIWCLQAVSGHDREIRLFAVWCARQVQHLTDDPRVAACNDVTERFANGEATAQELAVAWAASWAAGAASRDAKRAVAQGVALAATWAAGGATGDAPWAAVGAARAARAAGLVAVGAAAQEAQEQELRRLCAQLNQKEN